MKKLAVFAIFAFVSFFIMPGAFNQAVHNSVIITTGKNFYNVGEEIEVNISANGTVGFQVSNSDKLFFVDQVNSKGFFTEKFEISKEGAYIIRARNSQGFAEKAVLVGDNGIFVEGSLHEGILRIRGYVFKNKGYGTGDVAIAVLNENNGILFIDQVKLGQNGYFETFFIIAQTPEKVIVKHGNLTEEAKVIEVS